MQYLFLIIVFTLLPSIAHAKKPQDLGDTFIATIGMVLILGAIAAAIRFFKK